jgi:hypothetical protein
LLASRGRFDEDGVTAEVRFGADRFLLMTRARAEATETVATEITLSA